MNLLQPVVTLISFILVFVHALETNQNFNLTTSFSGSPASFLYFRHCTTSDPISVIFACTFKTSKPSQSTFPNHQTRWFQSPQFSHLHVFSFLSSFNVNPHDLIVLILVLSSFILPSTFIGLPYRPN